VAVDVLLLVPFLHEQLEKGALRSHRVGVDAVVVGAHFARLKPARLTGTDWHRGHPDRRLGRGLFCIIDLLLHLPLAREWRTTKSTKNVLAIDGEKASSIEAIGECADGPGRPA
jgi:hypothetical protein